MNRLEIIIGDYVKRKLVNAKSKSLASAKDLARGFRRMAVPAVSLAKTDGGSFFGKTQRLALAA